VFLVAAIVVNWGLALAQARFMAHKKPILVSIIAFNLAALTVFKYSALLVSSFNALTSLALPVPQIPLPIGISFFTFHAISYGVDVYRGKIAPQRRLDKLALYFSLFPHLIAGPIVRYADIEEQIDHRVETFDGFSCGMLRFIVGLAKKVLIANALAPVADEAFRSAGAGLGAAGAWLGVACYALQIYFDFSGYSDMAIGLARLFGFHFKENFDDPYVSLSVREFWTRWHISLSSWFRDYLYIPLGGNRMGKNRQALNLMIVFLFTGLWHGAQWSFLLWGAYYGVFRVIEVFAPFDRLWKPARFAYALLVVLFGWVLFRADTLAQAAAYAGAMLGVAGRGLLLTSATPAALLILAAGALGCVPRLRRLVALDENHSAISAVRWIAAVALLLLSMASLASSAYNPFIYFRF